MTPSRNQRTILLLDETTVTRDLVQPVFSHLSEVVWCSCPSTAFPKALETTERAAVLLVNLWHRCPGRDPLADFSDGWSPLNLLSLFRRHSLTSRFRILVLAPISHSQFNFFKHGANDVCFSSEDLEVDLASFLCTQFAYLEPTGAWNNISARRALVEFSRTTYLARQNEQIASNTADKQLRDSSTRFAHRHRENATNQLPQLLKLFY